MQQFKENWSVEDKASFLQRKIILASIMYYIHNESLMEDYEYDKECYQLVELQKQCDLSNTTYGYAFEDFDGSTGMHLYRALKPVDQKYLEQLGMYLAKKSDISDVAQAVPKIKKR